MHERGKYAAHGYTLLQEAFQSLCYKKCSLITNGVMPLGRTLCKLPWTNESIGLQSFPWLVEATGVRGEGFVHWTVGAATIVGGGCGFAGAGNAFEL